MNFAILGLGCMGQIHAETLTAAGHHVRLSSDTEEETQRVFDKPDLFDAVIIASPDYMHADHVCMALAHGKHVFCEKPLATSDASLSRIAMMAEQHPECRIACHLPLRYLIPAIPDVGNLLGFGFCYVWGRASKLNGWRGLPGYSMVFGGGIHVIDAFMYATGRPLTVLAVAKAKNYMNALLRSGDAVGGMIVDFARDDGYHGHMLSLTGDRNGWFWPNVTTTDKQRGLLEFLDCVKTGAPTNFVSAMEAHRVCAAIEAESPL